MDLEALEAVLPASWRDLLEVLVAQTARVLLTLGACWNLGKADTASHAAAAPNVVAVVAARRSW